MEGWGSAGKRQIALSSNENEAWDGKSLAPPLEMQHP